VDLPPAFAPLAEAGVIERPVFEPPAADGDALRLERLIGLRLPEGLRELYAVHDGSYAPLLPYGMSLLSYAAIETTWRSFTGLADEVQFPPVLAGDGAHYEWVHHPAWLPVATSDDLHVVLDLTPGPRGTYGQALMLVNECDYVLIGRSIVDFLRRWLAALDDGKARFDPNYGYAVPVGDQTDYVDFLRVDPSDPG
jgi:cell wall assembly regulator SMI1